MDKNQIIRKTIDFVKVELQSAEGGHDWFHIERVHKNALLIAQGEKADAFIIELAALLHDIADSKFHNGDESIGPRKASQFLQSESVSQEIIDQVVYIIQNMSFKNSLESKTALNKSIEFQIVQDADRLDAIGAIGIARCFNYGGFKNRPLYDPDIKPNLNMDKESYKKSTAPTINHFYEKLLLLKDQMNTQTGRKIAQERHGYMEGFLNQFYAEWNGEK
ncbi:MAG: phosphohydrolase [Flavobacteriaceae bacterium]|nr:phosphohydrolase [Flavobacteriaceae bacterium]|tara:strand:+ start:285572 stop:286231 length:660 start_codon:yes stop_codon:yes gene_type:complete